jgi:transcriptional antiterminator RfaH
MTWYLIQSKPRQELVALKNLRNQGYECYLPMMNVEKQLQNEIQVLKTPLFPRYLFINLEYDFFAKSWGPIRSTKGVSTLVRFGIEPAKIHDDLIGVIKFTENQYEANVEPLYKPGQILRILSGPFKGFESIYKGMDAQMRVVVLFEFMQKSTTITFELDKVSLVK